MAGEEQNTQQPTGGKGVGFQTKKQNISRGELPKQKGARGIIVHEKVKAMDEVGASVASKKGKRGCPTSGLSEQKREKMQNEDCQRCRKKMKAEFRRFQQKEKKLKTLCEKLGVAEEGLEAEFRRLQQIEIKHNALCDKFGVAQEALEMPIDNFMELDDLPIDDFMELDELPIDDQYKNKSLRLQNIEEGTMNQEVNQNAMPIDDDFIELDDLKKNIMFGSMFDGQSSTTGGEGTVINKSPHQYEVQLEDYNDQIEFSSSKHYSLNKLENKIIKLNKDHSN